MRPDKAKVVDEVWDEARILSFLDKQPMGHGADIDYSALLYAYRSMREDDFARFLDAFRAAGRNLNATGTDGQTVLRTLSTHEKSEGFRRLLVAAGAA